MFSSRRRIHNSATFEVTTDDDDATISSSASTAAQTTDGWTFTTQGSFHPGLGSISGKALLAFGKAEIAGIRWVWAQLRRQTISSKFPLEDKNNSAEEVDAMHDDLLDFCR